MTNTIYHNCLTISPQRRRRQTVCNCTVFSETPNLLKRQYSFIWSISGLCLSLAISGHWLRMSCMCLGCLYFLSSTLNPVLYNIMSAKYREVNSPSLYCFVLVLVLFLYLLYLGWISSFHTNSAHIVSIFTVQYTVGLFFILYFMIKFAKSVLKGQSHEIDLALTDITWRSRPEKWLGMVFKFSPCCIRPVFLFNKIIGAWFLLAGGFANL